MSRLPIRTRLALYTTLMGIGIVSLTGVIHYARTDQELHHRLDRSLREELSEVIPVVIDSDRDLADLRVGFEDQGIEVAQLLSPDGRVLDATPRAGNLDLVGLGIVDEPRTVTVEGLDGQVRALATPVRIKDESFIFAVATSYRSTAATLTDLRTRTALVGLLAVAALGWATYVVVGFALRPVERMRQEAAHISAGVPGERLAIPPADDELSRLGETFNSTIDRLEDEVRQRQEFVASASHEMRTPLTNLRAGLELAGRGTRTSHELEASLRQATEDTDRLVDLTEGLLDLTAMSANVHAIPTDEVRLRSVADAVVEELDLAPGTLGEIDIADDTVAFGDRIMIHRLLCNLVDNARVHGSPPVTISARRPVDDGHPDPRLELEVADHGPGIPAGLRDDAFTAFVRAPEARQRPGAGLGLAIVSEIVRQHGGTIELGERGDAAGFRVRVTLPAASSTSAV